MKKVAKVLIQGILDLRLATGAAALGFFTGMANCSYTWLSVIYGILGALFLIGCVWAVWNGVEDIEDIGE